MSFLIGMGGANEPRHLDRSPSELLERDGLRFQENPLRARLGARVSVSNGVVFTLENSIRAQASVFNSLGVRGPTRASRAR
ncbi:MAG: hypothetical protein JRE38_04730 [Deltaproteobacteria bacterium]|nr:hypothetical protein [Deltaproteobacteria bacterium]